MATIEEAFRPAHEIEDPQRFAGRSAQVHRAIRTLRSDGASFLIYGMRGVGKTSFAKQVRLIGMGNVELPAILGLKNELPSNGFRHPAIYYQCSDFTNDVPGLLRAILTDSDNIYGLGQFFDGTTLAERTQRTTGSLSAGAGNITLGVEEEVTETRTPMAGDEIAQFRRLTLEVIEKRGNWPLVVVIDELERLKSKAGLASVIKSCAHVKFVLVGVAEDFNELIGDHASVERQLSEGVIKIDPMSKRELIGVVRKGEAALEGTLTFGVTNVSQYVGILVQRGILKKSENDRYYFFVDPLFRVYVRLRDFKF